MSVRAVHGLALAAASACTNVHGGAPSGVPDASVQQHADAKMPETLSSVTVSLTFDDTLADQYQVGAMLAAHGVHATFFVNSVRIGEAGYLSATQVRTLRDAGNEIGGHTLSHPFLTQLTPDEARHEICDDRAALVSVRFDATSFAYPFGDTNPAIEQLAIDCGYTTARSIGGLITEDSCTTCPYANSMPPTDRMAIRTPGSVAAGTTFDELTAIVIQAEQHGGGWIPLVFHHVCDACNPSLVQAATLERLLGWLDEHGVAVKTVGELVD